MRYKLDSEGYFCAVFFGCQGMDCAEYNGTIPDGFMSNIKAYKLVDGVITYDAERAAYCESKCVEERNDYHLTTKKEVLELITNGRSFVKKFTKEDFTKIPDTQRYYISITKNEHGLTKPYVDKVLINRISDSEETTTFQTPIVVGEKTLSTSTIKIFITIDLENYTEYSGTIYLKGE